MSARGISLVCFDLGGVLIRICRSWPEGCRAAGVPMRASFDDQSLRPIVFELVEAHQRGRVDAETYFHRLSEATGSVYSPEELAAVHDAWMLGEYEGLGDVIDALHERGVSTAALSNTNHEHWGQICGYSAVMRLQHRLASHILGLQKPDHAIYRALESQLGVEGEQIMFFDDLEENVLAAREVGWRAHVIDPHGSPAEQITGVLKACCVIG